MRSDLAARWTGIAGSAQHALAVRDDLHRRWSEPHRKYHNLDHLAAMLDRVDELAAHVGNLVNVQLAAFYHDAVYDPTRGDNEQRSAKLAEDTLPALGFSRVTVADVARLVLLTATHVPAAGDADGAVLCDADLAVLAGAPKQYAAYASGVREEYAHVAEPAFCHGRAAVLKSLLSRPRLYHTEHGFRRWEAAARHNLATELALLTPGGAAAGPLPTTS